MSELRLLIPDNALCAAIAEQMETAMPGEARSVADAREALSGAAVIADADAADKNFFKALRETADAKRPRVFILGAFKDDAGKDGTDENLVTESFIKPLRLGHLLARLQFYLQGDARKRNREVDFGPYRLEAHNRRLVTRDGGAVIRLTEKETALLDYLSQSDAPVPREELLAAIWGYDARIDTHTLETHMYQLRRKLDPARVGDNWLINENGAYVLKREAV